MTRYSISGRGDADIFRDIIVLKSRKEDEKGVILLKYGQTFDATVALFDLSRLMDHYHIVLEPSWAGCCDPSILMYIASGQHVFIQTFTEEDHQFILDVGSPFVPVRLGPADWVDADLFVLDDLAEKRYDIVMVANWARGKGHNRLFRALRQIRDRKIKVLLIGFPWWGRTAEDIRREARAVKNDNIQFHIIEGIPQLEVARYLNECRVFVFLSHKEGDNKALVEAMFANVPAIVYDKTIGGAPSRINPMTGMLSSDHDLARNILYMLDHHSEYSAREWALAHTGSKVATQLLNRAIKRVVTDAGDSYTIGISEKCNVPNLMYKDNAKGPVFRSDYDFIETCRRTGKRTT